MDVYSHDSLTEREQEILTLIAAGLSNKAIAGKLFLSVNTIAWYVQQIFSKLHVKRRTEAVAVAHANGLLNPSQEHNHHDRSPRRSLPAQFTPFIGRESEISDICHLLADETCRLLTLVGQGGIGKTRLAIHVAEHISAEVVNDVYFIALQPLTSAEMILPSIASTIGLQLRSGERTPLEQLLDFLQNQSLLLIIDNFEHVLDGALLVSKILQATNGIKILVTSRESLNLQEEFLYNVQGLPVPDSEDSLPEASYSAIELFGERARHIRRDFSVNDQIKFVTRICKLVDGIPLAIELAASWLKTYSCEEIAEEIRQGLDILVSPLRNIPERHRSIKAVFDASWRRLSENEQVVFSGLSVFRGGCTQDAAEVVAGADKHNLLSLVDKSFIQYDPIARRYTIHELVRQYGEQQLHKFPDETVRLQNLHYQYYMTLLAVKQPDTCNDNQYEVMLALDPEMDNIQLAWNKAIQYRDFEAIRKSAQTFWVYSIFKGRFLEGVEALNRAIQICAHHENKDDTGGLLAELQNLSGMLYIRLSELDLARTMFEASHQFYSTHRFSVPPGWVTEPLIGLSAVELIHGNYLLAEALAKESVDACPEQAGSLNLLLAYSISTAAAFHQGKYQEAQYYAEQAYQQSLKSGEIWVRAEVLLDLGRIARETGDNETAKHHFESCLEIRKRFGDSQGVAAALNNLGQIALLEGNCPVAESCYHQSHKLYKELGDKGGEGYALAGLGETTRKLGDYILAEDYFKRALLIAEKLDYAPLTFTILHGFSEIFLQTERTEQAIQLLLIIQNHESSDHEAKAKARSLLQQVSANAQPAIDSHSRTNGNQHNLLTVIQDLVYVN